MCQELGLASTYMNDLGIFMGFLCTETLPGGALETDSEAVKPGMFVQKQFQVSSCHLLGM